MEWISVEDRLPPKGVKIKIKADYSDGDIVEAEAVFSIYDIDEFTDAWGWKMSNECQQEYGTLSPTHWMPLPEPPKE